MGFQASILAALAHLLGENMLLDRIFKERYDSKVWK